MSESPRRQHDPAFDYDDDYQGGTDLTGHNELHKTVQVGGWEFIYTPSTTDTVGVVSYMGGPYPKVC